MQRYQQLKSQILSSYCSINQPALREEAITHTLSVIDMSLLLAHHRQLNDEWCACAALLHDLSIFLYNAGHPGHAQKSAQYAQAFLTDGGFQQEEIDVILQAIANHSRKDHRDDPYSEVLKDADLLARSLQEGMLPQQESRRIRLIHLYKELELSE